VQFTEVVLITIVDPYKARTLRQLYVGPTRGSAVAQATRDDHFQKKAS